MKWLLLFSFIFTGLIACNKGSDRKLRLVRTYSHSGSQFPDNYEYDEQGLLRRIAKDLSGVPDAGGAIGFNYLNGRLSEIINSRISYAGLTQTVATVEYFPDGRLRAIKEELTKGRLYEFLSRYEFGYKNNNFYFDSCRVYRTVSGVEAPYHLYTFTRDIEGNILMQSTWSPEQGNWVANHTEEFSYGNIDNPRYKLGSPVEFIDYYSRKIVTRVRRFNFNGNLLSDIPFQVNRLVPFTIHLSSDNGYSLYYELH